ncbi:hypothetical protein BDN72DRAFT_895305 [Pluteus cervinus]|uniref:Uncharacterized protein n=1 Tax=Pluteus cervinus TaxID=181527 RepID=A0ACD3B2B2_9AGAR|nr:hypothetical protein BDN72DRAFT_895305 [Pluteus cervinus]
MALDSNSPNYRLLIHLLRRCYTGIRTECLENKPDTTSQLSFTPSSNGHKLKEATIRRRGNMLTSTPLRSFSDLPRILDAIASICVKAPRSHSYVTGLQYDSKSKKLVLTISTNTPQGDHEELETYVKGVWNILRRLSRLSRKRDLSQLLSELQDVVFARTLPKLQRRLDAFRPICEEWVSTLDGLLQIKKKTKTPIGDHNSTRQFAATMDYEPPFGDHVTTVHIPAAKDDEPPFGHYFVTLPSAATVDYEPPFDHDAILQLLAAMDHEPPFGNKSTRQFGANVFQR